jgi:hypothetical protein
MPTPSMVLFLGRVCQVTPKISIGWIKIKVRGGGSMVTDLSFGSFPYSFHAKGICVGDFAESYPSCFCRVLFVLILARNQNGQHVERGRTNGDVSRILESCAERVFDCAILEL